MNTSKLSYIIFATIVACTGCGRKSPRPASFSKPLASATLLECAKQQNIPVPVGFLPTQSSNKINTQTTLCYTGNLTIDQSLNFYKKSMELSGWEIKDFSAQEEGLLFCNKATNQCAISIRKAQKRKTNIIVTIKQLNQNLACKNDEKNNSYEANYIDTINQKKINFS